MGTEYELVEVEVSLDEGRIMDRSVSVVQYPISYCPVSDVLCPIVQCLVFLLSGGVRCWEESCWEILGSAVRSQLARRMRVFIYPSLSGSSHSCDVRVTQLYPYLESVMSDVEVQPAPYMEIHVMILISIYGNPCVIPT